MWTELAFFCITYLSSGPCSGLNAYLSSYYSFYCFFFFPLISISLRITIVLFKNPTLVILALAINIVLSFHSLLTFQRHLTNEINTQTSENVFFKHFTWYHTPVSSFSTVSHPNNECELSFSIHGFFHFSPP